MPITELFWIGVIGAMGGILGNLLLSGVQLFKWQTGEKKQTDSQTLESIANAAGELITPLREELASLRIENNNLSKAMEKREEEWNMKFASLQREYSQIQQELDVFKDWAGRLVHQLQSYRIEPVPMFPARIEPK